MKKKITIHAKGFAPDISSPDYLRTKLNAARDFHHITGEMYAEMCGVGLSTAYQRTRRIENMTVGELYRFAAAIGTTVQELFTKY